jgi:hypothetical protein
LETEATALRAAVEQVAQTLDQPVASFVIDGEEITISAGDVERVRIQMVKPRDQATLQELALIMKLRERDQSMPTAVRNTRFSATVDAIRSQALANGTVIDDPNEAVVND